MTTLTWGIVGWVPTRNERRAIEDAFAFWEDELQHQVAFREISPRSFVAADIEIEMALVDDDHTWASATLGWGFTLLPRWRNPKLWNRIGWGARQLAAVAHGIGHYLLDNTWHSERICSALYARPGRYLPWFLDVEGFVVDDVLARLKRGEL